MGGIFDKFPGSTNPDYINTSGCDVIVEPFAGSMRCTVHYLGGASGIKNAIVADADPTIRAVIALYKNPLLLKRVLPALRLFQAKLSQDPQKTWELLKSSFEGILSHGVRDVVCDATVSLIYRAVAHAGIVRCGKISGKINVSPGRDQLARILQKQWIIPQLPPRCQIEIRTDWKQAIKAIPPGAKAIVLIDPPYWSPIGMEPCYPGHQPKEAATLALFTDCLEAALKHPGVHRVVAKNYCGHQEGGMPIHFWPEMQFAVSDWEMQQLITGALSACGHRSKKHGRQAANPAKKARNIEAFWTFQKEPFIQQLKLIDVHSEE